MAIVGKWGLNGDSNALVGPNGTDTSITYVDGKNGKAASFNGSSSKISLPGSTINLGTGDFTVRMFVTLNASGLDYSLISNLTTSSVTGFALGRGSDNKFIFETWSGGTPTIGNGVGTYPTGLYRVAFVRSGSNLIIYVNGVSDSINSGTIRNVSSSSVMDMGRYTFNNSKFLNGTLDEVIIDNSALSAAEIKNDYLFYNGFI